ncbi:hypothetical protein H1P_2620001 [Hyella patelloides LEGE 07179]|uniref:Uncharacterized protein n=1 Tax=Hyella patelloides LEGE 07179 TaxID=945734 RepID=A0A563VS77_9CYAN|nr:hypothetical protein [Hyella patelloides]VEP14310.1 hypothetical protein H1P_2570001 [Hyella patelloides LEGE 07179]VEP14413.1 hypothetical protein H1P_2620001 [Hyella patelloides LEGE 07179]
MSPNTPPNLLTDLFIRFPLQVLTNPILDLLLFEQPQFINKLFDTYSHYFSGQGLKKTDDIRGWAREQKEKNLYFNTVNNHVFPGFIIDKISGKYRHSIMQNLGKYSRLPLNTKNNPRELMESLDLFLSSFFGERQVEYKPNLEALAARKIPLPLKYLYSFIGKYPGEHGDYLYTQDSLLNISTDEVILGKRPFLGENQGVWHCATEVEGNDPPVWIDPDRDTAWEYVCDSLAEFLVTYCLREAVVGSLYHLHLGNNIEEIISTVKQKDLEITLLWQGIYACDINWQQRYALNSFYLVEDSILIWNGWCGTNYKNAERLFSY